MTRKDILEQKKLILKMVEKGEPLYKISNSLKCKQETLVRYLKILKINYKGCQGKKTQEQKEKRYIPASKYLVYGSKISTVVLKNKLFKENYKERRCEKCGITQWLGKEAPLEIHHIDGDKKNNCIENLQILCANCHSFTESFCGKNNLIHKNKIKEKAKLAEMVDAASSNLATQVAYEFKSLTSHQRILKRNPEELLDLINNGQISKDGKITSCKIGLKEIKKRKEIILNSGVDFTKYGWKRKVEQKTFLTRHQIADTVNFFKEEFENIAFKRKSK